MFAFPQRTINDDDDKISVLSRFSGDGNMVGSVDFANAGRINQRNLIVIWPRDFVTCDCRSTSDIGRKRIAA